MKVICTIVVGLIVTAVAGSAFPGRSSANEVPPKANAKKTRKQAPQKKSDRPRKKLAVKAFMRGKLDSMQDILDGLTTEDFDKIRGGADRLRVMSMRTEWNVVKSRTYSRLSETFRRSAEALGKAAKKEDLDSAALANLRVTLSCINCHKHIRRGIAGPQ